VVVLPAAHDGICEFRLSTRDSHVVHPAGLSGVILATKKMTLGFVARNCSRTKLYALRMSEMGMLAVQQSLVPYSMSTISGFSAVHASNSVMLPLFSDLWLSEVR